MPAQVTDQVGDDDALEEAPPSVDALKTVAVPPGDDRLERKVGSGLEHGEVGAGHGGIGARLDVDGHVRDHVLGRRGAVLVEDDAVVAAPDLARTPQWVAATGGSPRRVLEQRGDAVEIPGVEA